MEKALIPSVSVVIPFLNGDNYIREAVASVFAQDWPDWELLLVDDGSTDASAAYALDLANRESRVRALSHSGRQNRGTAASRRLGLNAASGRYVLFLDHDDLLLTQSLQRLTSVLDDHPRAGAVFAATLHRHVGSSLRPTELEFDFSPYPNGLIPRGQLLRDMIRSDRHHPQPSSCLFQRSALISALDQVPNLDAAIYEDSAMLFALLMERDVYLLNEIASIYRIHPASKCAIAQRQGTLSNAPWCEDRMAFLRWAKEALALGATDRLYLAVVTAALPLVGRIAAAARLLPRPARRALRAILGRNSA